MHERIVNIQSLAANSFSEFACSCCACARFSQGSSSHSPRKITDGLAACQDPVYPSSHSGARRGVPPLNLQINTIQENTVRKSELLWTVHLSCSLWASVNSSKSNLEIVKSPTSWLHHQVSTFLTSQTEMFHSHYAKTSLCNLQHTCALSNAVLGLFFYQDSTVYYNLEKATKLKCLFVGSG